MSTKYKHWGTVPAGVLAARLNELADAVMEGPDVRDREFTRRIPAELDRDADLVFAQAAEKLLDMEKTIAELRQWQRDMVAMAAETRLTGYRELGQQAAKAEIERDAAQAKLSAIGKLSPTDYDDREQLLGALFRILRGMETDKEPTE